ncbi:MAG: homoserine O-acetyltransferase, partial [Acidobacteriota bacterium]
MNAPDPGDVAGAISAETRVARLGAQRLESGARLAAVEIAYRTWGRLDAEGSNAVVVCHALTGSADADDWWREMFGTGRALDPARDYVVCSNVLGGCSGSSGPFSRHAEGGRWGSRFPRVTIRDMVAAQRRLLALLGVRRVRCVLGGSMGGMQALEWLLPPDGEGLVAESAAVVAASALHSPWCIGWSEAQRQAIRADPAWRDGLYASEDPAAQGPRGGLGAARAIAMCSYRSFANFETRFARRRRPSDASAEHAGAERLEDPFEIESYLRYQGAKLVDRFDAATYVRLTQAMDSHDVGRDRGGTEAALRGVAQPVMVASVTSDVLYPPIEQQRLVDLLPRGALFSIDSPDG